jgi:LEA14-like dessication related protein
MEAVNMKSLLALLTALLLAGCVTPPPALEAPNVSLSDIRLLDVSLFEQRFALKLRVQNPNPVELPVTGMNIRLDINDVELGRGVSNQAATVPAYGETLFDINLVSNVARLIDQIRALEGGKGESLRYRLSGGVSVANRLGKLPFDYQGEIGGQRR